MINDEKDYLTIDDERISPVFNFHDSTDTPELLQTDYVKDMAVHHYPGYKRYEFRRILKRVAIIKSLYSSSGHLDMLDIGGGDPINSESNFSYFEKFLNYYLCLDPSEYTWSKINERENITWLAKKENPKIRFIKGNAEFIPIKKDSFDIITMFSSLDHCIDADLVLKNCYRLLKEEGTIFIDLTNHSSLFKQIERKLSPKKAKLRKFNSSKEHNYHLNPSDIKAMLENNGFSNILVSTFQYIPEKISIVLEKYNLSWILPYKVLVCLDYIFIFLLKSSGGKMHITAKKKYDC